jgi:uncharacterized repeat protein (TIGR03803 family)
MKPRPTNINRLAKSTLLCAILCYGASALRGQALEQVLMSFGYPDAAYPLAGLIQGIDGALYGTTSLGGTNNYGIVFKVSTDGTSFTPLYSFTGSGGDGANPYAGLVQGRDGALYGTTLYGGINGYGMVFKLSTDGSVYTPLYSFAATPYGDGKNCQAGLVQGTDGALYGTGSLGGTYGFGTVFKLSTNGTGYTTLHNFTGSYYGGDGGRPYTGLVQGRDGALYGTTLNGGTQGYGMVFKLSTDGTVYTPLYSFAGSPDGENPLGALVQGRDGALYGTTSGGGAYGCGTVFKLNTNGTGYTVLRSFQPNPPDGNNPRAALVQGSDGCLYGTTVEGGNYDNGMVFKLGTNGGGYTPLYIFNGTGGDGLSPKAGLVQGTDGALYGTTYGGGTNGNGTVYRLLVPPFKLQIGRLPDRNVWLSTLAVPNVTLQFSASTNHADWATLTNITGNAGTVQFKDLAATNYPSRFYRAVWTQ